MSIEMPEGWKRLKMQTEPLPNGLSDESLPITQGGKKVAEQLDIMKEMAEEAAKACDNFQTAMIKVNGNDYEFGPLAGLNRVLKKFKEWK